MASTGVKRSRCLKRLADTLEWGHTGDSSGCASSAHSTLWPAVLSTDKQRGSRGLPLKVLLVINNKHTCQLAWRKRRWHHHKVGREWALPLQVHPQLNTAPQTLWPPHLSPSPCPAEATPPPCQLSPCPWWWLAPRLQPLNRLCQLNSWPCAQRTACTSIPPNVLQGQKEPASTSLRSSWFNPNLGEMQAVLMERGEIVARYFLLQQPSNTTRILSKHQTHLPDSYTRKGLNSKVANLWVTRCYLW